MFSLSLCQTVDLCVLYFDLSCPVLNDLKRRLLFTSILG